MMSSNRVSKKIFLILIFSGFFLWNLSILPLLAEEVDLMNLEEEVYIKGVPFYPQEDFYCGPAALSSILNFYGLMTNQEEIAKEVYVPKLKGALTVDLLNYAKRNGFHATFYKGSLEDLKKSIKARRPLILFLNLGSDFFPVRHYLVVIGIDDSEENIITYSGREKNKVYSFEALIKAWKRTGYGTLQVLPKVVDVIM